MTNSITNGINTQQDLIRAVELVEANGSWSYTLIQKDMDLPYHVAKALKLFITRMGVIDDKRQLIRDWRDKGIKDDQ